MTAPFLRPFRRALALTLAASLGLACSSRTPSSAPSEPVVIPTPTPADDATSPDSEPTMTPSTFAQGPALTPAPELLAWLKSNANDQLLQVPVVIASSPLGITQAYIGVDPSTPPSDESVTLRLDQGALGVSLVEQLPAACAEGPCAVWLEGTWGALVSPGPGDTTGPSGPGGPAGPAGPAGPSGSAEAPTKPTQHPFAVRRLVGPVTDTPRHVRVQRP